MSTKEGEPTKLNTQTPGMFIERIAKLAACMVPQKDEDRYALANSVTMMYTGVNFLFLGYNPTLMSVRRPLPDDDKPVKTFVEYLLGRPHKGKNVIDFKAYKKLKAKKVNS